LAPKNTRSLRFGTFTGRRLNPGGHATNRIIERLTRRRPGKELVCAGAHGVEDQVRRGFLCDEEDAGAGSGDPDPLDGLHRCRGGVAPIHNDNIRRHAFAREAVVCDTHRNPAEPQQRSELIPECACRP
jgi:hypothetical protein